MLLTWVHVARLVAAPLSPLSAVQLLRLPASRPASAHRTGAGAQAFGSRTFACMQRAVSSRRTVRQ